MADQEIASPPLAMNREMGQPVSGETTVLAREDSFEGAMRVKGDATVLGKYEGEIECGSELMIGQEADVVANIRTVNLTIAGRVQGNIVASGRLRITSSGKLEGDAKVGALVVQEGGVQLGSIKVYPEGVPTDEHRAQAALQASAPGGQQVAPVPRQPQAPYLHATAVDQAGPGDAQTRVERVKKLWGEFF